MKYCKKCVQPDTRPGIDKARLGKKEDCHFIITPSKDPKAVEDEYILIGRGWVDEKTEHET